MNLLKPLLLGTTLLSAGYLMLKRLAGNPNSLGDTLTQGGQGPAKRSFLNLDLKGSTLVSRDRKTEGAEEVSREI